MNQAYADQPNSVLEASELDSRLSQFKRRILAYVSGKYRDKGEYQVSKNIEKASDVAAALWAMGYAVICPHKNTAFFGGAAADDCWLEGDMAMVERSDIVVMLDNWETSEGAKLERRLAMKLGIPVYYWSCHQLALQRLASNDHRYRDARAAILHRASIIGEITGWRPSGVHAGDSTDPGTCNSCGSPRRQGLIAPAPANLRERMEAALKEAEAHHRATKYFCDHPVLQAGDNQWVGAGESKASKAIEPVSPSQPIGG